MAQLNERKCNDGDSDEEMENNVLDTVQQPVTPIINQDTSRGAIQQQELIQHQRQVLDDIEAEREEKEESKRWVNDLIHPNRTGPLPGKFHSLNFGFFVALIRTVTHANI